MKTKIYEIQDVKLTVSGANKINVAATGMVRTGGWTEPQLIPSPDHAEDVGSNTVTVHFDFVATKPTGMATQAIMPIKAETSFPAPGSGKTLRVVVYAETNEKSDSIQSPIDPP